MSNVSMPAAGGVGVSGRYVGRIVEFERDAKGRVVREPWKLAERLAVVFMALLFWWDKEPAAWETAVEVYGPQPKIARVVEDGIEIKNGATTQGMNHALDVTFRNQTQTATWYTTIINNAAYTAVSVGDTAASHAGWAEWTGYNESVRQTWSPAAASAGSVANSTAMTFTNNSGSTVTIRGVALFSVNTKGATTGVLWATAILDAGRSLSNLQAFQVVYQVDLSPTS